MPTSSLIASPVPIPLRSVFPRNPSELQKPRQDRRTGDHCSIFDFSHGAHPRCRDLRPTETRSREGVCKQDAILSWRLSVDLCSGLLRMRLCSCSKDRRSSHAYIHFMRELTSAYRPWLERKSCLGNIHNSRKRARSVHRRKSAEERTTYSQIFPLAWPDLRVHPSCVRESKIL